MNQPDWIKRIEEREARATKDSWWKSEHSSVVGTAIMAQPDSKKNSYLVASFPSAADAVFVLQAFDDRSRLLSALNKAYEALEAATNALEDAQFIFAENAHDRAGGEHGSIRLLSKQNCSAYRDRLRAHVHECRAALTAINQEGK